MALVTLQTIFQDAFPAYEQSHALPAHMLELLVYAMSRPASRALGLRALGQRHVGYGVVAEHYPILRQAFLETVRVILGDKHTPQVEQAWAATMDTIIQGMLSPDFDS